MTTQAEDFSPAVVKLGFLAQTADSMQYGASAT
jgi:hypothetical protein